MSTVDGLSDVSLESLDMVSVNGETGGKVVEATFESNSVTRQRVLVAPYGAYRTCVCSMSCGARANSLLPRWHALVLYLYNDHVSFAPIQSQTQSMLTVPEGPTCSPKSMYRLAEKVPYVRRSAELLH